jgi:hypothetical protein
VCREVCAVPRWQRAITESGGVGNSPLMAAAWSGYPALVGLSLPVVRLVTWTSYPAVRLVTWTSYRPSSTIIHTGGHQLVF